MTRAEGPVLGVGLANQRETVVVWDRSSGRPVYPAIVWQDRRAAALCRRLQEDGLEGMLRERTGLCLDPYFSGTKLAWMLDEVEGVRSRAERGELAFGTVDTWILWHLTGGRVHATDVTNASRTLLFDIHRCAWDAELLELFGIPEALLPRVRPSSGRAGVVDRGILPGCPPVSGILGDQQAALFGQACFTPGMAKNTYGTGCFLLMHTGAEPAPSRNRLLTTIAWQIGDRVEYALEGSVFVGGALVQWLRDELGLIDRASECDELAESVPDSGGAVIVPAFTGLGAPHWDPLARGAILGLTRGVRRAHLCRAALEAIALQCADLLRGMEQDAGIRLSGLRVDGGAAKSRPLLQSQADLLGVPVIRPANLETTALGAAYLAGLAEGMWDNQEAISHQWREDGRFEPSLPAEEVAARLRTWRRAVDRAREWAVPHR
jgi:glycerol kinase